MKNNKEIKILSSIPILESFKFEEILKENRAYLSIPILAHFYANYTHHFALAIKEVDNEPHFLCCMLNMESVGISIVPCDFPCLLAPSDLYSTLRDAFEIGNNFQHMKEDRPYE